MVIQQWILVAWFCIVIVFSIAMIGRPRKVITPTDAIVGLFVFSGLIALVVSI